MKLIPHWPTKSGGGEGGGVCRLLGPAGKFTEEARKRHVYLPEAEEIKDKKEPGDLSPPNPPPPPAEGKWERHQTGEAEEVGKAVR